LRIRNSKNVLIKECNFFEKFPNGSTIKGLDEEHLIDGVIFENVTVNGQRITSLQNFGIKETPFVKNIVIK
jgi:hypothetical protein